MDRCRMVRQRPLEAASAPKKVRSQLRRQSGALAHGVESSDPCLGPHYPAIGAIEMRLAVVGRMACALHFASHDVAATTLTLRVEGKCKVTRRDEIIVARLGLNLSRS